MAPYLAESLPDATSILPTNIEQGSDQFFNENNEGRPRRPSSSNISSKLARRKRLQHFLTQIKLLVRQGHGRGIRRLSTLDALDKVLQMLHHSHQLAPSPPANSPSSSIPSPAREQSPPKTADQQQEPLQHPTDLQLLKHPTDLQLLKSCGSPQSGSADFQPTVAQQSQPMLGRRFLGSLFVSLPEGIVLGCQDSTQICNVGDELKLSGILRPGDSLLALLHGKGAQTMLLNAFCGHSRRRMYARMKWGNESTVRACELLCEFSIDPESMARRLANIQLFCVQSGALLRPMPNDIDDDGQQQPQLTFTTRHNSGCALIYLDSNSIPLLGHFPSEVTGKSLFSLVHPEHAPKIRDVHQQLHSGSGIQIVRTPGLRLLAYSGKSIAVDSEWAAFVNPWTRHIEMVVGRHTFTAGGGQLAKENVVMETSPLTSVSMQQQQFGEQQSSATFVHALLSEPVPEVHSPLDGTNANELPANSTFPDQQFVKEEIVHPAQQLSYNQINCLENVHRLLKSQSQSREENVEDVEGQKEESEAFADQIDHPPQRGSPSLTRELLQKHDQRWEEECRDHWRRRLSAKAEGGLKRSASGGQFDRIDQSPPAKQFRRGSDGGFRNRVENPIQPPKHPPQFFPSFQEQSNGCFPLVGIGNQQGTMFPNENNLLSNVPIHHPQHLLEQLLHAANVARNTLALKLFQQETTSSTIGHQQLFNN